jgi:hypothetical protein
MCLTELEALLDSHKLQLLGVYQRDNEFRVLVGNAGSGFWEVFANSEEYADGFSDPLDRWSKRIGDGLADFTGAEVTYPFEGPPYAPFLDWAGETGRVSRSPLSIFIHHKHGLWHAYRFMLSFDQVAEDYPVPEQFPSPCESCSEKPCLSACPVSAFSDGHFDVEKCMSYLKSDENSDCRRYGCVARQACPVMPQNRYIPEHAKFHMQAFVSNDI